MNDASSDNDVALAGDSDPDRRRRWHESIGPGLITACVVIGPGSILTSSKVGAAHGYSLCWVVGVAVFCMMVFVTLGARLGTVATQSPAALIADRAGRPLAILIGLSVFFISGAFQFGNNLGVDAAFARYFDFDYTIVAFNALALAFVFGMRDFYKALERLMMCFVGLMLVSFAVNLAFARPDLGQLARGFVPGNASLDLSVLGLIGTTFVISAAYYQAYLVKQKGWTKAHLRNGLFDARVGAGIMALITLMIMSTAAAVLSGKELTSVGDVAEQLRPAFGPRGEILFSLGLFSAAYSSFLVNSMIGGFVLADGLGLGEKPTDRWPRLATAAVLLTGMGVGLYVIKTGVKPVPAIVAAQAVTVIASPLLAGALWWLTSRTDVMGKDRNGPITHLLAGSGFLLLLAMAAYTAIYKVWPAIQGWLSST